MKLKKIISLLLALFLIVSIIPSVDVSASGYTLEQLKAKFPDGKYWNHQVKAGHYIDYTVHTGAACGDVENTVTSYPCTSNYLDVGVGGYACNSYKNIAVQCAGFARKLANLVYGVYDCAGSWPAITNKATAISQVKPGDVIWYKGYDADPTHGHWVFVTAVSGSTVTLGECNYGGNCLIRWGRQLNLNNVSSLTLYKAPYAMSNSGTSSNTITYTSITTSTYYIKNVATGTWLSVSEGKDINMNAVNLWTNTGDAMKMVIAKAPTGYKIRPYVCKSRLVNPNAVYVSHNNDINIYDDVNDSSQWWQFEKVGNYYVIHNVQNPSCVLDAPNGKTSIAYARTYTGANSQKWILECVSHSYNGGTVTTNATCQKTGIKTYTCTVCSATKTETISKTNHNYNSKEIPSTCINEGYTKHQCTICGDVYTSDETPKMAHDYNETYKAATCMENGYYLYTCSFCGSSYDVSITKTGHSWDYGKITTNATCNSTGVYTYTCTVCGETKTATIEKTGHRYVSTVIAPTCYSDGYTKHTCSVCGDEYISDKQRSLAHDYVETKKEKTCTEDGYIRIDCSVCKDMHKTVFYHTGHEWDNGKVTKAPTTTQTGIYTYTCTACGEIKTDVMPVVPEVQEPTTSEPDEPDTDALPGDVDDDGQVTASDARIALRASVGLEALPSGRKAVADMDSDGEITASDARKILRIAVGLDKN